MPIISILLISDIPGLMLIPPDFPYTSTTPLDLDSPLFPFRTDLELYKQYNSCMLP